MSVISSCISGATGEEKGYTPNGCLRLLMDQGFVFDQEIYHMKDGDHEEFKKRRWRAEVWESRQGKIKGVGEATRKALAVSGAVLDLVKNLERAKPPAYIPQCVIPRGVKISPMIITTLQNLCERRGLGAPQYTETLIQTRGNDLMEATCTVGDLQVKARSYNAKFAKLKAALKVYDKLSHVKFRLDEAFIGRECLPNDVYGLVETEQTHVVNGARMGKGPQSRKRSRVDSSIDVSAYPILMKIRASIKNRKGGNTGNGSSVKPSQSLRQRHDSVSSCSGFSYRPSGLAKPALSGSVTSLDDVADDDSGTFLVPSAPPPKPKFVTPNANNNGTSYIDTQPNPGELWNNGTSPTGNPDTTTSYGGLAFRLDTSAPPSWLPPPEDGFDLSKVKPEDLEQVSQPSQFWPSSKTTEAQKPAQPWSKPSASSKPQSSWSSDSSAFASTSDQQWPQNVELVPGPGIVPFSSYFETNNDPPASTSAAPRDEFKPSGGGALDVSKFLGMKSNWSKYKKSVRAGLGKFRALDEPEEQVDGHNVEDPKETTTSLHIASVGYANTLKGAHETCVAKMEGAISLVAAIEERKSKQTL